MASDNGPAPAEQIEDQHYYCDDDQQVNQVAADASDKTQQPQNEKNNDDCPKHGKPPSLSFDHMSSRRPPDSFSGLLDQAIVTLATQMPIGVCESRANSVASLCRFHESRVGFPILVSKSAQPQIRADRPRRRR
jgi:hypothetical protein